MMGYKGLSQDAQKGRPFHPPSPRRVETRRCHEAAAASEEAKRTLCPYVEPLSEART